MGSARDTPKNDGLGARGRDLAARLRVSQEENKILAERADDILSLRRMTRAIGQCEDPAEIPATVLKWVSILEDISYCAFLEPENASLVIRHEYAAFADGGPTGAVLHTSPDTLDELLRAGHGPRELFLPPFALSIPGGGLVPSSVVILSSAPGDGPRLLFLAADRRRTELQMAALLPLLWQIIEIARTTIEKCALVRQLTGLSPRLEQRPRERNADPGQADSGQRLDVADPERAEHCLRLAGVAVQNIAEGLVITDPELSILAVNRAFCEITGYGAEEIVGRQPRFLRSGRHGPAFYEAMWASILGHGSWQGEVWNRRKDGSVYPELLSISVVRDERGRVTNYVGVSSDLSAIRENEARLEFLAHHDPLTGLPNELLFTDRGEHALARAHRSGGRVAVMLLNPGLDRLKHLNDTFGHAAVDELVRKVADRLAACVQAGHTIGRLGGGEFTVLLEDLSNTSVAGAVARRILDALSLPFTLAGNELSITANIGVSVFPEDGDDLPTLMKHAASAMTGAQRQARGSLHFYTAELARTAETRFRLEGELRQALRRNEFVLHFQPQVSVRTGEIVGVEALLRWRHPERGLVFPAQFIPLAEDLGIVEAIGTWAMRSACRQVRDWMAEGLPLLRVAVNVSEQEIFASPLTERITATLAETGLAPDLLEVEVTEGSLVPHLEAAVATLKTVKALGVTLALDDFGTGSSSLTSLRYFPIDRLKLDGSFIRRVSHDETDQAIARAAVELGHGLKLGVAAEEVETPGQLEFLRTNGCDTYQGRLFAPALPATACAELLRSAAV